MAHSDDEGLVLPPKLAPIQVVIVPIYKGEDSKFSIDSRVGDLVKNLKEKGIRVKYDNSDHARPGWKFAEYELKGVPIRIAIGARDLENNVAEIARRDTREKSSVSLDGIETYIEALLNEIQEAIFNKAVQYRNEHITEVNSWDEFCDKLDEKCGFISAHWDGTSETEEQIKAQTKATIRCIPLQNKQESGICIFSGKPSKERVLFARAY
jgi:prolyl-tRNA synthetase